MPILNVPEVGIVTMEAITKRPVVVATPGRRRDRDPAGHEHGPRASTTGPTTAPAARPSCATSRPGSSASARTRRSTERSADAVAAAADARSSSPAAPGSSVGAVVRVLRERGDDGRRPRPRPAPRARSSRELGARARRRATSSDVGRLTEQLLRGADARRSTPPAATGSGSRSPSAARCGTPTSARRRGCSTRPSAAGTPRIVYVSTVNVFGNTHGAVVDETYRRDLARGLPELVRRDEVPGPRGRRAADRRRRADRDRPAEPGLRTGRSHRVRRAAPARPRRQAAVPRRSTTSASGSSTSTTSRPGSSPPSTAARSASRTSSPGPQHDARRGDRDRGPARRPSACRGCALPDGAPPGRWRRSAGSIGQPNLREVVAASAGVTYLGVVGQGERGARLRARDVETRPRATRARRDRPLTTLRPMARELPMFTRAGARRAAPRRRPRPRRSRSARLAVGRRRSAATPTGSRRGCRRARTTTTSRACSAA